MVIKYTSFHPRPLKLPKIQVYIGRSSLLQVSKIKDESAEYKVPSEVPHKRSIIEEFFPAFVNAKNVTKSPANMEVINAKRFTGEIKCAIGKRGAKMPFVAKSGVKKTVAITAPSVAPELMPKMPGSANGFLKKS